MFEQSKKSVLYIATLSALALMSGVASAATTGTITDQEGVNGLGLDGSQTNDISWSNENGTGFEPTTSLQIVGNNNDVTLSAIAVQIEFVHTGNIGSKCLQFDVQPLVFENKPLLARKELQLAVAGTPPRGLTRAF